MISKDGYYAPLNNKKKTWELSFDTSKNAESWLSGKISILTALLLSLTLNAFLILLLLHYSKESSVIGRSTYANLANDYPMEWTSKSPYYGENDTVADLLWKDISIDNGTVALKDTYVDKMGLPVSQRFPWDQQKGLYLLNGFHSMHCLKTIRQAVFEFDKGLNRSEQTEHILHCLDALRQDVLCYADDTPRYTGFQANGRSGTGQFRQCKDWSQLETWAQQNSACWRYIHPHDTAFDTLERHKFCPDGSPYIAMVKKVFKDEK